MIERKHLKKIFNISKADCKIFEYMLSHDKTTFTSFKLSEKIHLHLTTIQRAMKKLHGCNLIDRYQINLEGGSYIFKYKLKPFKKLEGILIDEIKTNSDILCETIRKAIGGKY